MKRTFVGVGVAAVMAVLMAGCGGGSDTTTQANAPVTQPTTAAPATTTPTTTTAPSKGKKDGKSGKGKAKSGSGSSSKGSATPTAAESKWARDVCTAMSSQVQTLQPPSVNPQDPKASVDSLVKFLAEVEDQIGTQRNAIAKVGAPPIEGAGKAYDRVLERLDGVRKQVAGVRSDLGKADPKDGQQMMKIFTELGKQLQGFASYKGPVADLVGRNGKIAHAIAGEQACATLR